MEAGRVKELRLINKIIIVLVWQTPAIICALAILSSFFITGLTDYAIFILQFWFTPLAGFLSLAGIDIIGDKPLYYYLLLYLPFIISIYYLILSSIKTNINKTQ